MPLAWLKRCNASASEDRIGSFEPLFCTNAPCMVLSYDVSGSAKIDGRVVEVQRGKTDIRSQLEAPET